MTVETAHPDRELHGITMGQVGHHGNLQDTIVDFGYPGTQPELYLVTTAHEDGSVDLARIVQDLRSPDGRQSLKIVDTVNPRGQQLPDQQTLVYTIRIEEKGKTVERVVGPLAPEGYTTLRRTFQRNRGPMTPPNYTRLRSRKAKPQQ